MSLTSLSALGRLTRCARANSDRYAIIRNFFQVQRRAQWQRECSSSVAFSPCPRRLGPNIIGAVDARHFHMLSAVYGKRNKRGIKPPPAAFPLSSDGEQPETRTDIFTSSDSGEQVEQPQSTVAERQDQHPESTPPSPDDPIPASSYQTIEPPPAPPEEAKVVAEQQTQEFPSTEPPPPPSTPLAYNFNNYSQLFRRLASSLPHLHRPTRDDFLNVANGFWQRLNVRFKWFTIKSFRKFNADDISAFVSVFLMSQTLWILVGTTTFFSVVFAVANGLGLQHLIARMASNYLTSETGVTVIFESAIVPKWKDLRISFKNVYVSRRPSTARRAQTLEHVSAIGYDVSNHPANHHIEDEDDVSDDVEDFPNVAQFDLTFGSIDVTFSLWRWLDGRGIIEDAVIKGVRGVLDRRSITWDPDNPYDPADFRHKAQPGDFDLDSLQIEDVLITIYQPGDFRPFTASIFRADIHQFRKRWMFYDFLCAENVVGQFDGCLASLHKPQSIGRTTESDLADGGWARMSRIRIDGVNVDHLKRSSSSEGPMSWITSGKVDAVLDIKFPRDPDDGLQLNDLLEEIANQITTTLANPVLDRIPGQRELAKPPLRAPELLDTDPTQKVSVDIDIRFRDIKAALPIFTNDISYVNNALVRPIVAFMNANRTLVPIHCRIVKDIDDFDGSWNLWDCGLMDEMAVKMYDALAFHVSQVNMNRRMRVVSIWSLQKTASAVLSAMRSAVDPMSSHFKQTYLNMSAA